PPPSNKIALFHSPLPPERQRSSHHSSYQFTVGIEHSSSRNGYGSIGENRQGPRSFPACQLGRRPLQVSTPDPRQTFARVPALQPGQLDQLLDPAVQPPSVLDRR